MHVGTRSDTNTEAQSGFSLHTTCGAFKDDSTTEKGFLLRCVYVCVHLTMDSRCVNKLHYLLQMSLTSRFQQTLL